MREYHTLSEAVAAAEKGDPGQAFNTHLRVYVHASPLNVFGYVADVLRKDDTEGLPRNTTLLLRGRRDLGRVVWEHATDGET